MSDDDILAEAREAFRLAADAEAENAFIGIEKLTDKELETLRTRCAEAAHKTQKIVEKADAELNARRSHHKKPEAAAAPAAKTVAKAPPKQPAKRKPSPKRKAS